MQKLNVRKNKEIFKCEYYLENFAHFIRSNLNQSAALTVVATRPKDLTRETVREVKLLLDNNRYSEKLAYRQPGV
jgi:hypothetical protein